MELVLKRPLVFFDIESTGTNPYRDRIVEIAVIKVMPDGSRQEVVRRINPTIPIPDGASAVHGIYDADVADCPTFDVIAHNLYNYLEGCDLAGYNIVKFDVPMLQEEFKRCNLELNMRDRKLVDVFNIFCRFRLWFLSGNRQRLSLCRLFFVFAEICHMLSPVKRNPARDCPFPPGQSAVPVRTCPESRSAA